MWLFWLMIIVIGVVIPIVMWLIYWLTGCKGSMPSRDSHYKKEEKEPEKVGMSIDFSACITCVKRRTCSRSRCDGFINDTKL